MHGGLYLARNVLVTVGEADHPRSLAHPQHDDRGQHLHTSSRTLLNALTADIVFFLKKKKFKYHFTRRENQQNLLVQFRRILTMGT